MRFDRFAILLPLFLAAFASGCVSTKVSYRPVEPEIVQTDGATGVRYEGTVDGVPYATESSIKLQERNGMTVVCALVYFIALEDISSGYVEALNHPQSTMTITRTNKTQIMVIRPSFVPVIYHKAPQKNYAPFPQLSQRPKGACVETSVVWADDMKGARAEFSLFRKDTRKKEKRIVD